MEKGQKLKHKHYNIEIELVEPTSKGWKVLQLDKTIKPRNTKWVTKHFSDSEIRDLFEYATSKKTKSDKMKHKEQLIESTIRPFLNKRDAMLAIEDVMDGTMTQKKFINQLIASRRSGKIDEKNFKLLLGELRFQAKKSGVKLEQIIDRLIDKYHSGSEVFNESTRYDVSEESVERIKSIINKYKTKDPDTIDDYVANMNQRLSNYQIALAYKKIGILDKMRDTYSVKKAKAYANKKGIDSINEYKGALIVSENKEIMKSQTKLTKLIETMVKKELSTRRIIEASAEYTDTFNRIDWDKVGSEILKTFKIKTTLKFKQRERAVEMLSDDIIKQCGIFQYALGTCHLVFFNNRLTPDSDDAIFWANINLSYPGNGLNIGELWVKPDGQVIVQKTQPRKMR